MERITESTVPTSDIVASVTMLDGFMLSQIDQLGGSYSFTRQFTPTGIINTSTDPRGNTSTSKADIAGRNIEQIDAADNSTSSTYCDCCDQVASITDALGNIINSPQKSLRGSGSNCLSRNLPCDYDNIDNRKSAQELANEVTYDANAVNQYSAINSFVPEFDLDGNQIKLQTGAWIWTVTYNAENRPVTFTSEDGLAGHSNMGSPSLGFNYIREDTGFWSSPYNIVTGIWRHFRSLDNSKADVLIALKACDVEDRESHMLQMRDFFSNYGQGHSWYYFGHLFSGTEPDDSNIYKSAFEAVQRRTHGWEEKWEIYCEPCGNGWKLKTGAGAKKCKKAKRPEKVYGKKAPKKDTR